VHQLNGVPLVATLHPGELLRRSADKALAWADLCLAKAGDAGPG
ncbi:MAG TPA: uracil-DNA glycosylase, partial [Telluria sp.]|nr:uracil-DNA glycosylase [Telluria sp.]